MIDYLESGYAAAAADVIQNNKVPRKLTASDPSKIQAIEGRYAQPYLENAPLPPNEGMRERQLKVRLGIKLDFATMAAKKLQEATDVYEAIASQHVEADHPASDDCTETLAKLEEAYNRLHERAMREYHEAGEIAKLLYSGVT
jgi:hypothetical protein